jgi:UPF0716 protein FxsA
VKFLSKGDDDLFIRLLLLFTAIPLLELMLLVELGATIGLPPTIGIVILTGALGAWAARTQGFYVLARIQEEISRERLPGVHLLDGGLVLVGGVLLITPGLLTDIIGFALMIPAVRELIRRRILRKVERMIQEGRIKVHND